MNVPHNNGQRRRHEKALERAEKKLETNHCWDELRELYEANVVLLLQHTGLSVLARDQELQSFLPNKDEVIASLQSLARDLRYLNDELQKIHAHHADRTGGGETPDDVLLSIQIYEHYQAFMERHNAVVLPTALQITEQFNLAEQARQRAHAQAMAQDPSDTRPIDVEIKTPAVQPEFQDVGAGILVAPSTPTLQ